MTGEMSPTAHLRQLSSGRPVPASSVYILSAQSTTDLGRDPRSTIALSSKIYSAVSRRHAQIRPAYDSGQAATSWWLCDLNSSNGTYLNNQRLQGCECLRSGDRIKLGKRGPEFEFEYPVPPPVAPFSEAPAGPPAAFAAAHLDPANPPSPPEFSPSLLSLPRKDTVTLSQLFPIVSTGQDLIRKAYLAPSVLTIAMVVSLFIAVGQPVWFNLILAGYIAIAGYYFVYQLCGKPKPWWVVISVVLLTIALLRSPLLHLFIVIFRESLPGRIPEPSESVNVVVLLIRMFFGAGLMEELLKALPLALFAVLGRQLPSPWNRRIGIWEPLDGILLGSASAIGFTLLETLGQYVPDVIQHTTLQAGEGVNQLIGLQLLITRLLGSISGHIAYSGYFGYFIGLSVLKPKQAPVIILTGYLTAAGLHSLWNAMGTLSPIALALVGILSYAFLAAAILKARRLSPTRSQNFATQLKP